jgi:hypothetical protein
VSRVIIKLEGKYLEWSTVADAPTTFGMSREDCIALLKDAPDAARRLARADSTGTSAVDVSLDALLEGNRAGPNETCLSRAELLEFYVRRAIEPNAEELGEYRARQR